MQKVSYMGDGYTTDFCFNFPFYTNTDIVVLKNNQTATDYNVVGTSAGLNSDIPYIGGKIVFDNAPVATDSVTIYRHLPLTRIVDYQPTEKINPTILNQDMNYMMEVLKDTQDKIDIFTEQYNEIVNKESTDNLISKINQLNQLIDNDEIINKYTSNCITKIPQDIKFTLSNGTLTLKTGSKCYLKTDTTTPSVKVTSDLTTTQTTNGTYFAIYDGTGLTTVLTTTYDYSTLPNTYSLPLGIVTVSSGAISNIDQTFNGFGYIGSTVFVLPGVKGLAPNGRNTDGTLKNTTIAISTVKAVPAYNSIFLIANNYIGVASFTHYTEQEEQPSFLNGYWYKPSENMMYSIANGIVTSRIQHAKCCRIYTNNNNIATGLTPYLPFRTVDYNDTEYITHQSMPSSKYTDLTLPTSGNTLIAPADGYFTINKAAATSGEYINMINSSNNANVNSIATGAMNCRLLIPVSKGDVITINYTTTGTTNWFRFIYANGAK